MYSNYNVVPWGDGLDADNTHDGGMFPSDGNYDMFLDVDNVSFEQMVNTETYEVQGETHSLGYQESNASASHPSFVPTPLQTTMGTGFFSLCEQPSEGGSANWGSSISESDEVDVDLSMRVQKLQLGSSTLSTSDSAAGFGVQKKPRKREEGGVCAQCNQTFSRKSDAKRHENTAHRREVHACPMCNSICGRRDALRRHIRDQHQTSTATLEPANAGGY